jgi:hypothetical protein
MSNVITEPVPNDVESVVVAIYAKIKSNIVADQFGVATLMVLLPRLMEAAGKYQTLDGTEKKNVVIGVVNRIIADNVTNQELATALQQLVPTACDVLYDCWKNRYIFAQKVEKATQTCLAKCNKH